MHQIQIGTVLIVAAKKKKKRRLANQHAYSISFGKDQYLGTRKTAPFLPPITRVSINKGYFDQDVLLAWLSPPPIKKKNQIPMH